MRFIRVKGRVIPLRNKATEVLRNPIGRKAAKASAVAGASVMGIGAAITNSGKKSKEPSKFMLGLGYGLQVASGIISGLPARSGKAIALGIGSSIAADTASTAAFAKATSDTRGTKMQKLKQFGKHQAIGTTIGYTVFGATVLANPATRATIAKWTTKIFSRGKL